MTKADKADGVVLADVGGTNVRFAVLKDGVLGPIEHMAVADHRQFGDALAAFMARRTDLRPIRHAMFGGGRRRRRRALRPHQQSMGRRCGRASRPLRISPMSTSSTISKRSPGRCRALRPSDLRTIGGGEPKANAPMVVLGPGTGSRRRGLCAARARRLRAAQRRRPRHAAERLVARGRDHREVAAAVRARIRRTRLVRARPGKSLPRHRVARSR